IPVPARCGEGGRGQAGGQALPDTTVWRPLRAFSRISIHLHTHRQRGAAMSKVYFITGSSSGFGRALSEAVLERGDRAILTARRPDGVADLVGKYPDHACAARLDVTDEHERQVAIQAALERFGRVDVLVNNAGRGSLGAAEEFSSAQIRAQMELNFFAAIEMTRAMLPVMRRQKSGHILNMSSI